MNGNSRDSGLLSAKQREYLLGESEIEEKSAAERRMRQRIRDRIRNAILDFEIVGNELRNDDWSQLAAQIRDDSGDGKALRDGLYWNIALSLRFGNRIGEDMETIVSEGVIRSDRDILSADAEIETARVNTYDPGTVEKKLRNGKRPTVGEIAMAYLNDELEDIHRDKLHEQGWISGGGEIEGGASNWDDW